MDRIRTWLLPALLAIQQLAYWPGRALRDADPVGAVPLTAALVLAVVVTAALGARRDRPVAAALTVEAALVAGVFLPEDATLLHALGVLVALYSVTVRCPGRTALVVGAVLAVCEAGRSAFLVDSGVEAGGEAVINSVAFLTVAGLGRSRRRWLAGRRGAALELARAESERSRAALTERERLARELHDVSAHHLTSVVVTADAARRLGDRRPELTAQALEFAADTGRETLAALHRLVAMMRTSAADEESALEERVGELAAGFARLGLRPAVDVTPDLAALTGPVAEAAFGIVREALTNALRYAPGAAVRVRIGATGPDGALDLAVEDDGAAAGTSGGATGGPAGRQRLGSGRGTAGMRERATALGGTLTAGPRPDGPGWSVRARLPRTAGAPGLRARRPRALRGLDLSDGAVALAAATLPLFAVLADDPPATVLACGPVVAHALPLLWRRRAPWAVLCAVLATAWTAPLALAFGLLTPAAALCLAVAGALSECVAVYAVAAFAGPPRLTWPAIGAAGAGLCLSWLAVAAADGIADLREDGGPGLFLFLVVVLGTVLLVPMAAVWGLGATVRTRRERVRAREDHALTATVWSAVAEAHEERRRIAAELRGEVLRHADAVVKRAEAGDLDGVAEAARAGLAAMRDLLAALREVTAPTDVRATRQGTGPADVRATRQGMAPAEVRAPRQGTAPADAHASRQGSAPVEVRAPRQGMAPAEVRASRQRTAPADAHTPRQSTAPADTHTPRQRTAPAPEHPPTPGSPALGTPAERPKEALPSVPTTCPAPKAPKAPTPAPVPARAAPAAPGAGPPG